MRAGRFHRLTWVDWVKFLWSFGFVGFGFACAFLLFCVGFVVRLLGALSTRNSTFGRALIFGPYFTLTYWLIGKKNDFFMVSSGWASLHPAEEHLRGIWEALSVACCRPTFHLVSPRPVLVKLPCTLQLQARVRSSDAVTWLSVFHQTFLAPKLPPSCALFVML